MINYPTNPKTDYAELMLHDFDIALPKSMPKYIQEQLYKQKCMEKEVNEQIRKFELLFPWCHLDHTEIKVDNDTTVIDKSDGSIVYDETKNKFYLYRDEKILVRAISVEKLKRLATERHGITFDE